jgi:hypothetical protein
MSTSALSHDVKAAAPVRSGLKPLPVNRPGDMYEQEAERAARDVVGGRGARPAAWSLSRIGIAAPLQRECSCGGSCEECKKKKKPEQILQRDAAGGASPMTAPPLVHDVLRGAGHPLDRSTRSFMESKFGYDFTSVRIFHDDAAAKSARSVAANAYTVGDKIVFNQGRYAPDSHSGRRLLAHELAHVVQQSRGGAAPATSGDAGLEADAQSSAHGIERGTAPLTVHRASGIGLARDAAPSEGLIEVKFPDGVKQLTQEQFAQYKETAIRRLRNTLQGVASAADYGRKIQTDTLAEYQGGVESLWDVVKKPKALIGIASDIKAGVTPPYIGMWSNPKSAVEQGLAACDRGDLSGAARALMLADTQYKIDMATWNAYIRATIGGAEGVIENLETVRDVSFAIALVAGAAIAAPIIAGAVATTGATGIVATGITATTTAVVTGTGGAVLRGGSTAGASLLVNGKVDTKAAWADTKKGFKEGAVTGFTAGLGTGLQAAGKGAQLARPLVQGAARRCLTEAGVNVGGEVTTELLDKVIPGEEQKTNESPDGPKPVVGTKTRAALTGCLSGALGVPVAKLGRSGSKVADVGVNVGVGFVDAKLQGQSNKDAALAGVQNAATSFLVSKGHQGSEEAKARKAAAKQEAAPVHAAAAAAHAPEAKAATGGAHPQGPEAVAPSPTEKAREKVTKQLKEKQKAPAGKETAPAIHKEEAKAKAPVGDGHEAVVTEHGIGKCSPGPCPVIQLEYAKELEANPKLKAINEKLQAHRAIDAPGSAKKAAALINTLEAIRGNAKPAVEGGLAPGGPGRGTTREQWKAQQHDQRAADRQQAHNFGSELGLEPVKEHPGGIRQSVRDAVAGGFVHKDGSGKSVGAALEPHGSAGTVRDELGITGKHAQSAHVGPTAALRDVVGYSRSKALTTLLPPETHAAFDTHWKEWSQAQRRAGKTETTVGDLHRIVVKAIEQTPKLTPQAKGAIATQLHIELYRDLGLSPSQKVRLPFEKK